MLTRVETIAVSLMPKMKPWTRNLLPASSIEYVRFNSYLYKYMKDRGVTKEMVPKITQKLIDREILIRFENHLLDKMDSLALTTYGGQLAQVANEWNIDFPDKAPPSFERFIRDSNIIGPSARWHYYGIES